MRTETTTTADTTIGTADHPTNPIPVFRRIQAIFAGLGVLGAAGLLFALVMDRRAFFASWMFGFVFWMALTAGAVTLTCLHHAIRAKWSLSILRVIEAANKNVLLMGVCWLVVAFGLYTNELYQWGNPEIVRNSELLQRKAFWLNVPGWLFRGALYFAFWLILTRILNGSSKRQDETRDERLGGARASLAAPCGVVHVILLTFAMTDWVMSLDPAWFSTIYGVWWMVFGVRLMIATGILVMVGLRTYRPFNEAYTPLLTKDIGNMLLGFTMLWAYITLSQFLIIWSGNLPEEITFYANRFTGPMVLIGGLLVVLQFFTPFLALLAGRTKRDPKLLYLVAGLVVCASILDVFWQITPFFKVGLSAENLGGYALDFAAWAAIGGVWMWVFMGNLIGFAKQNVLLPLHDTRLQEWKIEQAAHHA